MIPRASWSLIVKTPGDRVEVEGHVTDGVADRHSQGLLRDAERRGPAEVAHARAVLRRLAGLSRDLRALDGRNLRGGRERVARIGSLAEPGPRRDVDAFQRRTELRRGQSAEGLEGVDARREERAGARGRRGAGNFR